MSSALSSNFHADKNTLFEGSLNHIEIIDLRNASCKFSQKHQTSQVEAISTHCTGSAHDKREKENCGAFTQT